MAEFPHAKKPCGECPWRPDVAPGRFPPERFVALAPTAYDMALRVFACHKSPDGREFTCAGFLLRGATHNLSIRLAIAHGQIDPALVSDGGHQLFDGYRQMAVANGVPADHPAIGPVRNDA